LSVCLSRSLSVSLSLSLCPSLSLFHTRTWTKCFTRQGERRTKSS
jgi:hypothetical protein